MWIGIGPYTLKLGQVKIKTCLTSWFLKKKEGGGLSFFREITVNTRIKHLLLSVQHRE